MPDLDPAVSSVLMDVRFAIGQDYDLLAMQMPVQSLFQAFGGPQSGSVFSIIGHAPDQFTHVAENGLEFLTLLTSTAEQTAQFQTPAVARPLCNKHRHAKRHDCQDAKNTDQEGPGLGFPPFDVAEVMQQDNES